MPQRDLYQEATELAPRQAQLGADAARFFRKPLI